MRLVLNHVFYNKLPLNIGCLISKNIRYCRLKKYSKNSIWVWSTITRLGIEARVVSHPNALPYPKVIPAEAHKEINQNFLEKIKKTRCLIRKQRKNNQHYKKAKGQEKTNLYGDVDEFIWGNKIEYKK